MWENFINFLEQNMGECPFLKYFGIKCLGCGLQRSFLALIKGNYRESIELYPALIPMLFVFVFLVFHLKFNLRKGPLIIRALFYFCAGIIIISYIYYLIDL